MIIHSRNRRRLVTRIAGLVLALPLIGCSAGYTLPGTDSGGGDDTGTASLSITEPTDQATVTQPFTLRVESSVELGAPESGKDHFHLSFDGKESDYTVEPDAEVTIDQLSPGEHTITVTLQHADHSPAGAEAEITVTVQGAGAAPPPSDSGGDDGY